MKKKKEKKMKQILLRLNPELYQKLAGDGQDRGISVPNMIKIIIYEYYKGKEGEK